MCVIVQWLSRVIEQLKMTVLSLDIEEKKSVKDRRTQDTGIAID
jgi:hypothetical protein